MILKGSLASVDERFAGGMTREAHTSGFTVLKLVDAVDFQEDGGEFIAEGVVHSYLSADLENDELTLETPFPVALLEDAEVKVYPEAPSLYALVRLDPDGSSMHARVPQDLVDQTIMGIRQGLTETCTLEQIDGEWVLQDLIGQDNQVPSIGEIIDIGVDLENLHEQLDEAALWIAGSGAILDTLIDNSEDLIPEAVIDHLWTNVVRARKITTDMLLVGSGENLVVDPYFVNAELNTARINDSLGTWTLVTSIEDLPAMRVSSTSNVELRLRNAANSEGRFYPVTSGDVYRVRVRAYGSGSVSIYPTINYITPDGTIIAGSVEGFNPSSPLGSTPDWYDWEWVAPADAVGAEVTIKAAFAFSAYELFLSAPSLVSKTTASLIVDGSVAARHIDAESIAAAVGEFIEISAQQILAGNLEVVMTLGVGGEIRLGDVNETHIVLKNNEITIYSPPDSHEGGGTGDPKPMITMGGDTGGAFTAFDPSTGDELGGIRPSGNMFTPHMDAGSLSVGGQDLSEILASLGRHFGSGRITTSHSEYSTIVGLVGFEMRNLKGGWRYRIRISLRGGLTNSSSRAILSLVALTTGTPNTSSPDLSIRGHLWPPDWSFDNGGSNYVLQHYHEFEFVPSGGYNRLNVLLCGRVVGTGTANTREYTISIIEEPMTENTLGIYNAYSAPPAMPFDETARFADHYTYSQHGLRGSQYKGYYIRHGQGGSSYYRTFLPIPSSLRTIINGGGVTDMWVELTFAQDNAYSTPWAGTYTGSPGTGTIISNPAQLSGGPTSPGETKWLKLTTAQRDAISAGANLVIGRASSATLVSYYGSASGTLNYRPRFRVKGSQ